MKQVLRNIFFLSLAVVSFTACSEDKSNPAPEIVGAKLTSFGFYAEDNADVLDKDYLMEHAIAGGDIDIKIPSGIDKSKLVARFSTSSDNPTVTVHGELQVSGESANDYTRPVDFILTNTEKNNRKYTVRIRKPIEWTQKKSIFSDFRVSEAKIKVNPIDNLPYVLVVKSGDGMKGEAALLKFDDDVWTQIGGSISEGKSGAVDFTFDENGSPYVVYQDGEKKVKTATVKYFDGSTWVEIGSDFHDVETLHNSICFDGNGTLFVFSTNNKAGGVIDRRKLNISTYRQGSWASNITIPGRVHNAIAMRSTLKNGILYLAINDIQHLDGTISVYTNKDDTWTTIADGIRHDDATQVNYTDMALDVDASGNVFVMGLEKLSTGFNLVLHNYLAKDNNWSIYGTPILTPINASQQFSMKLDGQGFPAVFYNKTAKANPTFVTIDKESRVWTSPYEFGDAIDSGTADIAFDTNGKGYSVYINTNKNIVLGEYTDEDNN